MTAAVLLPSALPFDTALIRQRGHDDFRKREAATRMLQKVLADTHGVRNYSVLLSVKKAARENWNPEIRLRSRCLFIGCALPCVWPHRSARTCVPHRGRRA
jgi:hypothetical protein